MGSWNWPQFRMQTLWVHELQEFNYFVQGENCPINLKVHSPIFIILKYKTPPLPPGRILAWEYDYRTITHSGHHVPLRARWTGCCVRGWLCIAGAEENTKQEITITRRQSGNQACLMLGARNLQHTWCSLFSSCLLHVIPILLEVAFKVGYEDKHRSS